MSATPSSLRPALGKINQRLATIFLAMTATITTVVVIFTGYLYVQALQMEHAKLTQAIGDALVPGIQQLRAAGEYRVQAMVTELKTKNPAIAYIVVTQGGEVIVAEGSAPPIVQDPRDGQSYELTWQGQPITETYRAWVSGYRGQESGTLRLGLRRQPFSTIVWRMGLPATALFILLLVGSWPWAVWQGRRLGHSMQTLAQDFDGIMRHSPVFIGIADQNGQLERVSESYQRIVPSDERLKNDLIAGTTPEITATLGGEKRTLLVSRFPVSLEKGAERTGFIGADVTDWRQAQAERDRLAAAVEHADDAIVLSQAGQGVIYANPAFYRRCGWERGDILGHDPVTLWLGHDRPYPELRAEFSGTWRGRIEARRADQTTYTCDLAVSALDDREPHLGQVWVGRDVSDKVALQERLNQAQKMEAIGQLAGGLAHDLNNILTIINGTADLIAMDPLTEDQKSSLAMISDAGNRAATLTRQLLAFSRRQVLDIRPIELNQIIEQTLSWLRRVLGSSIQLDFDPEPALWVTRGDIGQVQQVLLNLAVNARDAMPNGGSLRLRTRNIEEPTKLGAEDVQGYVLLEVEDSGTGIAPEILPRIFEPFFTTKGVGKGTGLGLATVHGIIRQSGGEIWVESTLNHGTTFKVALPRSDEKADSPTPDSNRPLKRGAGQRILLVEDEPGVQVVVEKLLTQAGYNVVVANDGLHALEIWHQLDAPPHLLLTDLVMPRLGGAALAKALRQLVPELPVIFLSGYSAEAVDSGVELISAPLIAKPPVAAEVLETVARLLRRATEVQTEIV